MVQQQTATTRCSKKNKKMTREREAPLRESL